ncbi:short-chain dehydrogenase/reductase [Paenibacillus baekrokdamisoli]|uniref:Short-chain dehydrogenase/reductase n=1 Tax=Paenibacillus baekrokdamisoli TaxID=1712516 RepID=A0A3G9J0A2_9BACL|nr:SDR family oxidoreductase [Paenibacillus baekrokdamisoli]MBB3071832.1 NAD(P)-dependent dehydrogenase (short-subunit alcohol dehydrogenase family) [Paenibacillus baekrokdamisoli]BBH24186.1 short-chain dehydrogenase/reductase [Paenibacillus baekrokdamisoli]
MNKVIAITGASAGIGLATALKFASNGWRVYAGTRNLARDQEQYGDVENLQFLEMEVTRPETLQSAFDVIEQEHGRIDVLFCNAGYGFLRALGQATTEEIEAVFNTNVHGVINTIKAGLPLLRKSTCGHIVATSSVGGLVGQPFNEIYCASKFAIEGLLEGMATYYKPLFNIDITLLEPGAIATNFNSTVLGQIQQTGGIRDDEYKAIIESYIHNFSTRNSVPQTAESVADVMADLVNMETKPLRIRTSEAAEKFVAYKIGNDPSGLDGMLNTRKLQLNL